MDTVEKLGKRARGGHGPMIGAELLTGITSSHCDRLPMREEDRVVSVRVSIAIRCRCRQGPRIDLTRDLTLNGAVADRGCVRGRSYRDLRIEGTTTDDLVAGRR